MFEVFQWSETPFKWCWALYQDTERGRVCIHLECRFDNEAKARDNLARFRTLVSLAPVKTRKPRVRLTA